MHTNLTDSERERRAYITGQPALFTECDHDEMIESRQYKDVAEAYKAINCADDLEAELTRLWAYEAALPDDVECPATLAAWVTRVTGEYEAMRRALVLASDALKSEPAQGDIDRAQSAVEDALERAVTL